MRLHLVHAAEILLGLVIGSLGLGIFSATVFPLRIAEYISAVMLLAFFVFVWALVVVLFLFCGMVMQLKETDGRILEVINAARRKQSGRA